MNQRQRRDHRKPICRLPLMMVTMMALLVSSVNASQALTFTVEPQDVVVPEGDSVLLRCSGAAQMSAKHSKVVPVIRWRGPDGLDLNFVGETFRTQLKNGSLYISSVEQNRGLTGSYQCLLTVDEIGTIVSRSAVVSIANLPDLNQDFMEMYLLAGQTAYFRCMLGDMQTGIRHSVQWYKDDMPLRVDATRMLVLPNGALEIDEVSPSDRGVYHCNVTAGNVVRLSSKTNLNLKKAPDGGGDDQQMAPSFLVGPSPKTVREGETATLDCVANGVPKPEIKWLRNGEELDLKDLDSRFAIIGTGSLQISSVEDIDSGNYQCRASNPVDSLDAQATVLVQVPPKFIQSPKDKIGHEKEELELECAIRGKPTPLVQWLKNGDVITPNEYMQLVSGHNLRILGLLQSDAGMFQCVGTNPAGSVQAGARLRIVQPGKLRKNKQQSQRTKSLQSNQFSGKRRKSNGMRIKSGGGGPFFDESFESSPFGNDTQDGGGDLLLPLPKGKPKKYASMEKALNDRNYGELSSNLSSYEDDYDEKVSQETFDTPKRENEDEGKTEIGKLHSGHGVPVLDSGLLARLPNYPGDLVATIVKPRFVTLSWMEPTKNPAEIVSYTVYYKIANSEREQKIITKSHDEQQMNIQNLMPGKKYQFRVVANTNFGPSESSQILEVTTQPEENIAGPPRNVEGYARSHKEIYVKWDEPSLTNGEILKYRIYYTEDDDGTELYHDSTTLEAVLSELRPYTEYTISVVPFNKNGMGDASNEIKVKTLSSVPSEPPNNVTLEVTSSTTITVHWEPPDEEDRNGQITGYKIRYRKMKEPLQAHSTPGNIRYFELSGLDRHSEYQVKIAAMTVNGSGPFTEWNRVMTLENDLDETQVPGKPVWIRILPGAENIALHWGPPPQHEIKIRSYVLGWGRGIPDEHTIELKESERYYVLKNLEANTEYVVSLRARNIKGDGPPIYDNIKTRDEDPIDMPVKLEMPVGLRAITMSSSSIVVYWIDTTLNKNQHVTDNRHYTVRYFIVGSSNPNRHRYHNTTDLNCMISDLRPNTQYEFAVKVVKGRRESDWSMSVLNTTYQNVPITPPRELTVRVDEQNAQNVILQWLPPKHSLAPITGYNIYYTTNTTKRDRDWSIEAFAGEETMMMLPNLKPYTTYYFKVQARSSKTNNNAPFSPLVSFTTSGYVIPHEPNTLGGAFSNDMIPYIAIAAGVIVLVIIIVSVSLFMCLKKPPSSPEHKQKSYQKNSIGVPKPPDLWIHHDQMELKNIDKGVHSSAQAFGDGASSSGALTLPRSVVHEYDADSNVPSHVTNSLDKRAYVQGHMTTSMNSTMERPQYPRTQYNTPANRSHMTVDTGLSQQSLSQPQNNSLAQTPEHPYGYEGNFANPGYPNGGPNMPGGGAGVSTIESAKRGHPLKSFSVPGPPPTGSSTPINKHPSTVIRPQNQSPYKKPSFSGSTPNRLQGGASVAHSTDEIQRLAPSTSTEELNQEMANLEGLMKDLSAITANEFEC